MPASPTSTKSGASPLEQTKDAIRFKDCKTGRNRAITLPGFVVDELRQHKAQQAEALLKLGVRQSGDTLVCCREDGNPKQPRSLTHEFAALRLRDLPRVRFHDLRHSHATQLLADGVHPKIAQERLGHSTITTTMDLYSHVTEPCSRTLLRGLTWRSGIVGDHFGDHLGFWACGERNSFGRSRLGEVAEWLKAPHSKCGIRVTVSGVRIPPSPPNDLDLTRISTVFWTRPPDWPRNGRPCAILGLGDPR
jgi:Phage integrase family